MIASLIPISLLIDGLKTELKLLTGQAQASLPCLLSRETLITLISVEEVKKLVCRKTLLHINKGNPLFARESKGNPPTGLSFNIVYYYS